jgi:hypothetical protein
MMRGEDMREDTRRGAANAPQPEALLALLPVGVRVL